MEIKVPSVGESVEVTVAEWLKPVGAFVEVDEPIVLVESDKAEREIPRRLAAPSRARIGAGEDAAVGDVRHAEPGARAGAASQRAASDGGRFQPSVVMPRGREARCRHRRRGGRWGGPGRLLTSPAARTTLRLLLRMSPPAPTPQLCRWSPAGAARRRGLRRSPAGDDRPHLVGAQKRSC